MLTTLYWLSNDLRIHDNAALLEAANSDRLIICHCENVAEHKPHRYNTSQKGIGRQRFQYEGLRHFDGELLPFGQLIVIRKGDPVDELSHLIHQHHVGRLICSRQFGVDEQQILRSLQRRFDNLTILEIDTATLFNHDVKAIQPGQLPKSFTPFRKQAECLTIEEEVGTPHFLPPPPLGIIRDTMDWQTINPAQSLAKIEFQGGRQAALARLSHYFSSHAPLHYKDTRNALDGIDNSSKFSLWLNQGSLSARELFHCIKKYERDHGANESTYWLFFELLWREYFQWLALKEGKKLFSYAGKTQGICHGCFYPERYQKWCKGNTPYPLVNALMKQLTSTGYMSNRGRQIVASCFIHEMAMDWRYGAAWFEHHLLDYNVGSNWGNWQYIAGVGADPRGGRHFNIEKQTALYDPEGQFIRRWGANTSTSPWDSVDMVDWPIAYESHLG